jgi:hypothetical protein
VILETAIVAPLGPVRFDAVILTFVRPPAGAFTMIWVSTYSPRPPERLTEEVVPGASLGPTLTRPGATHVLNAEFDCVVPVPLREIVAGEFVALLATTTLPVTLPEPVGAKVTFKVAVFPAARMSPLDKPLTLKPGPEMLSFEMVMLALPELVSVTLWLLLAPTFKVPKLKVEGLTVNWLAIVLTVRVAGLLFTLPAELLTITVNCDPLSEVVVAGVV